MAESMRTRTWSDEKVAGLHAFRLPLDFPRPPVPGFRREEVARSIPGEVAATIFALFDACDAGPVAGVTALAHAFFQRLADQRTAAIATASEGGARLFSIDASDDPSVRDFIARVDEALRASGAEEPCPLSRNEAVAEIARVAVAPEGDLGAGIDAGELMVHAARADVFVAVSGSRNALTVRFDFDAELLTAESAESWVETFATFAGEMAGDAERPLSRVRLAGRGTDEEKLSRIAPRASFAVTDRLHEAFEAQVDRSPDAVALVASDGARELTYRELDEESNRLARALRERGVGRGELVGILLDRTPRVVTTILGVLKAGAAYLPIDRAYPPERARFMVEDAGASLVVTERVCANEVPSGVSVFCLDDERSAIASASRERPAPAGDPDDPAYVNYTSGSTGQPKGAAISHRNVRRLFLSTEDQFAFDSTDVWTLFHSYAFDFSVWEMWGALLYGGRVVVVPYAISRSPREFYALLAERGVTVLSQTPSAFRQLIRAEESLDPRPSLSLRCVVFGGEALELSSLTPWLDRHGDEVPKLVNMYGITETTVHVTYRPIRRADVDAARGSRIGAPLADLSLAVVGPDLDLLPLGFPGELIVGGAGVCGGYLNRASLTAERFITDPFADGSSRAYRTGDLARMLPGGDVEYLRRIDDQVQLRGFRVELGEIEARLRECEGVGDATVVLREDDRGEAQIVGYVVARGSPAPTAGGLRAQLESKLPDYMVPGQLVLLDTIPLTPHGKVDRRALPAPDGARPELESTFEAPHTDVERTVADIYQRVLGVDRVGLDDNFFELGGDSMRITDVAEELREAFSQEISLVTLFERPTVRSLASHLTPAAGAKSTFDDLDERARRQRESRSRTRERRGGGGS